MERMISNARIEKLAENRESFRTENGGKLTPLALEKSIAKLRGESLKFRTTHREVEATKTERTQSILGTERRPNEVPRTIESENRRLTRSRQKKLEEEKRTKENK